MSIKKFVQIQFNLSKSNVNRISFATIKFDLHGNQIRYVQIKLDYNQANT